MWDFNLNQENVIYGLYCECYSCAEEHPEWIRYVGLTERLASVRFTEHLKPSREKMGYPVGLWIAKHGRDNIRMVILEQVPKDESLQEREVYWIEHYQTFTDWKKRGLNRTDGSSEMMAEVSRNAIKNANSKPTVPWAKVTPEQVIDIRAMYREGVATGYIAEKFGINPRHCNAIIRNLVWVDPYYNYVKVEPMKKYKGPRNISTKVSITGARMAREYYWSDGNVTYEDVAKFLNVSISHAQSVIWNKVCIDEDYTPRRRPIGDAQKQKLSEALKGKKKPAGHGAKVSKAIRGGNHGMSKLGEKEVLEIVELLDAGVFQRDIAEMYGVQQSQVSRIHLGLRWGHLTGRGVK